MEEKKYIIMTLILMFCFTGCSSLDYRGSYYGISPGIYPGVRNNIKDMGTTDWMGMSPVWVSDTIRVLDLPFSFALDTVCLPYDAVNNWDKEAKWKKLVNEANYHYNLGKFEEAIELTKKSLTVPGRKDDVLSLANLAVLYKIVGKDDLVESFIEKFNIKRANSEKNAKNKVDRLTKQLDEIKEGRKKETDMLSNHRLWKKKSRMRIQVSSANRHYTKLVGFLDALEENIQNGKLTSPK